MKFDFGLGSTEIEARALDDVLRELGVDRVDWVKINVEGAELETLKSLKNTLKNSHPKVIVEVEHDNVEGVATILSKTGYVMREIPKAHGREFAYPLLLPE